MMKGVTQIAEPDTGGVAGEVATKSRTSAADPIGEHRHRIYS